MNTQLQNLQMLNFSIIMTLIGIITSGVGLLVYGFVSTNERLQKATPWWIYGGLTFLASISMSLLRLK